MVIQANSQHVHGDGDVKYMVIRHGLLDCVDSLLVVVNPALDWSSNRQIACAFSSDLTACLWLQGWSGGDGTELEEEEGAPAGCGRVMEGQLRFDSARYGAALDIVFTGSVEQ